MNDTSQTDGVEPDGGVEVAEPTKYVRRALEEPYYPENIQERLNYLWENPVKFEEGIHADDLETAAEASNMPVTIYVALHLGILFGVEYEHAYPTGRREDWPVPVEERPKTEDNDG